jgi:polyisoprenoid-binding protein YceI
MTSNATRTSGRFFDVEEYPEMTFQSTRIVAIDEESSQLFGDLKMHGVTREVKLEVVVSGVDQDPWGNTRVVSRPSASSDARTST